MAEKTKYRRICENGHWDMLQYEVVVHKWWGTRTKWYYVPRPFYRYVYGRENNLSDDAYVCSLNTNLDNFVKTWTDINDYLKEFEKQQRYLEEKVLKETREVEARRGTVKYMN